MTDETNEMWEPFEPSPPKQQGTLGVESPVLAPSPLAAKLADCALDVETVEKRGENTAQGYTYATAEDVIAAATKVLLAAGIISSFEPQTETHFNSASGGVIAFVSGVLNVEDTATGETRYLPAMGSGADKPGDKALTKAMTSARKYAYLHLLGIPIGDDPDAETRREKIAHAAEPKLSKERAERLMELIHTRRAEGMTFDDLSLLLGSVGIDAPEKRSIKSVKKRIETLTEEQATTLEGELNDTEQ